MLADATAPLVVLKREDPDAAALLAEPLAGHFAEVGGGTAIFFRWRDHLHVRLGEADFDIDELRAEVRWSLVGKRRHLEVVDSLGAVAAAVDYEIADQSVPIADDPTPFVEEEDFDFGQFIARVIGDPKRRGRIYK